MSSAKSTRLAIVEQSLTDILDRLTEIPAASPATVMKLRELRTKALAYERSTKSWLATPPTDAQRGAMLKLVLELNVQVMEAMREAVKESERPPPAAKRHSDREAPTAKTRRPTKSPRT